MRKLIPYMTVLMAVSLAFLGSACSKKDRNQTGVNRSAVNMKDSDAEKIIKDRLNADPQLSAADLKVSANTNKSKVKISGTVNSEELRTKAVQIAQSAMPGFTVSDTIDVKPREMARSNYDNQNRGEKAGDDDSIRTQIESKLQQSGMRHQDVKVDVNDGVVTLRGNVSSAKESAEIQRTAQQVQGVKRIDNKLQIGNANTQTQPSSTR